MLGNAIALGFTYGGGWSSEYISVYESFTNKPDPVIANVQNIMVTVLVAAGVWDKRDAYYIFAQQFNTAGEAQINWKSPGTYNAVLAGSPNPTFTALLGFTSDGANGYLSSTLSPLAALLFLLDDASFGAYSAEDKAEDGYLMGSYESGSKICQLNPRKADDTAEWVVNSDSSSFPANENSKVVAHANRVLSTHQDLYIDGILHTHRSRNSSGIGNIPFFICCRNLGGSPNTFTTRPIGVAWIGGGLTATETKDESDAITAYVDLFKGENVPVIIGEELKIYGDTLANIPIVNTLEVTYACGIGLQIGNDFVINAVSDDDQYLHITVTNGGVVIRDTISKLVVKAKVNTGSKTLTMIGASIIDQGGDIQFGVIRSIFDSMTWTGIGLTKSAPDLREAYPGKTYDWLVNHADSPFTKAGVVDIPAYYTDNGLSVPDFIYMAMGVNDAFQETDTDWTDAEKAIWLADISELIDAFLAHDGSVQIIVGLMPISENTGAGWENNYPGNTNQDNYIKIIHQMWDAIIETYEGNKYDARVSVAYAPWGLDRDDGYPKTAGVHNNGLHPDESGHLELGEGLAFSLNNLL